MIKGVHGEVLARDYSDAVEEVESELCKRGFKVASHLSLTRGNREVKGFIDNGATLVYGDDWHWDFNAEVEKL